MNKQIERKSGQDRIAEKVIYKRELNHSSMILLPASRLHGCMKAGG